jgi:pantetheine-phosphate adenylyltransferase
MISTKDTNILKSRTFENQTNIKKQKEKIIYVGSFDPIHKGHIDIIKRTLKMFSLKNKQIVIIITNNKDKKHKFNIKKRTKMVEKSLSKLKQKYKKRLKIISYTGIISDYANKHNGTIMIRGIRNEVDFKYELNLEKFTRKTSKMETVFLTPNFKNKNISSSKVRKLLKKPKQNKEKIKKMINKRIITLL